MSDVNPFNFDVVLDMEGQDEVTFGKTGLEHLDPAEFQATPNEALPIEVIEEPTGDDPTPPVVEATELPTVEPVVVDTQDTVDDDEYQGLVQNHYKALQAAGMVYDNTVELKEDGSNFEEVLEKNELARNQQIMAQIVNDMPEDFRDVIKYGINGGKDLQGFLSIEKEIQELNYDLTKPEDQEAVVRKYLTDLGNDDVIVQAAIDRFTDTEVLKENADKMFGTIKTKYDDSKAAMIKAAADTAAASKKASQDQHNGVVDFIQTQKTWQPTAKNEIYQLIYKPSEKHGGDSFVGAALHKIRETPEHLVQFAKIVKDLYDFDKGFKVEDVTATRENIKAGFQTQLASILQTNTRSSRNNQGDRKIDWTKTEIAI